MEKSSFFNSYNKDRRYKAEDWAAYFASFIGNGVFPVPSNGLQVMAGGGMNILIRPGKAWINGYFYINDDDLIIPLQTADGILRRYDRIVVRWDLSYRRISIVVKRSANASSPTPPPLQRDADAYEICLADVIVNAGVTSITQANITDRRFNTELCGIVAGVVQQIDPTFITAQFDQFFAEYKPRIEQDYSVYAANIDAFYELYRQRVIADFGTFSADMLAVYELYRQNAVNQHNSFAAFLATHREDSAAAYEAFIIWLNAFKVDGTNDFTAWFNGIKDIMDEEAATKILLLVQELQTNMPTETIGTIEHELGYYPSCFLYKAEHTAGISGAGVGGAGGGNLFSIPAEFEIDGFDRITVKTVPAYTAHKEIHKINEKMYGFAAPNNTTSLLLILR